MFCCFLCFCCVSVCVWGGGAFINPHHPQLIAANSEKDLVLVMDAVGHYYVKVITWCCNYLHPFEASR